MVQKDTTTSILSSAKHFFSGTMLSRISGVVRDVTMAAAFGTEPTVAALFVAYRFSHMFRRLLGEGAMQSAFVPQFETLRKENPKKAIQFFKDLYLSLASTLVLLIIMGMAILLGVIYYCPLSDGNLQILKLTTILAPGLLFICLNGLNASLLQCEKSYFIPSVAPVFFNCVWIAGTLFLFKNDASQAMPWLALFVVFACMAQWVFTTPKTYEIIQANSLSNEKPELFSKELKRLAKPLLLGITGIAASQVNNVLDVVFARFAHPEGPAFLWYAARIQQLPIGLFGVAISGALLPPLSRAFKQQDYDRFKKFLDYGISRLLFVMIPISFAYIVGADTGISLLFGRGNFDTESIVNTTWCLWGYTLGILPLAFVLILAPTFYAQNNYRTPTIASVISVIVNIILNTLFVVVWKWGPASVALATSISTYVNFGVLYYMLNRNIISLQSHTPLVLKLLLGSTIAAACVLFADANFLNGNNTFKIILDGTAQVTDNFSKKLLYMGIESLAFLTGIGLSFFIILRKTVQVKN